MEEKRHFLIVGAGLSGISVGLHLLERGQKIHVIDSGKNHSSGVAAGLINPIVFRRMAKSWRVDDFLPYAVQFYRKMELETGLRVFEPIIIRRLFAHEQERNFWIRYQDDPAYAHYLQVLTPEDDRYTKAINHYGTGRVIGGGVCSPERFMEAGTKLLKQKATYAEETFDHLKLSETTYAGNQFTDIIFCEGYQLPDNPWFKHLPFIQTKGEMLVIKADLPEVESLNRKCFILPQGNKTFRVGSTYIWHTADLEISERGKEMILENLAYITDQPVEVEGQQVGVRPTTYDRRPFIGSHPTQKNYHLFNGMGTKGYLNAPLLAKEFVSYLLDGLPLDKEVDLNRV